jgi:uncharacterized protein
MARLALLAAMASVAAAYHCSNDAPTPLNSNYNPPPQKSGAPIPAHMQRATSSHRHSEDGVDTHTAPFPGYARALAAAARAEEESAAAASSRSLRASSSPSSPSSSAPLLSASPLPLSSVSLLPGGRGFTFQNLTLSWLLSLDPDRLLTAFRTTAGLPTNGTSTYGGWEDSTCLLRGHIAGGHFLSGASLAVNATGNAQLRGVLTYMVGELAKCQANNANVPPSPGYLSAFTVDHFERLENNTEPIWAPFYTIHKILSGLYDAYTLAGIKSAAPIISGMLSYFAARIRNVVAQGTVAALWALENIEFGGMNEIAARWWAETGEPDALYLSRAFDKPCWLGPLALGDDILSDMHANTHLPVVLGAAEQFELTGDPTMQDVAMNFFDVVQDHTFASGGSSSGEWWGSPNRLGDQLDINGIESCSTYNILKISRKLFTWGLDATFLDFYERAKFSGMFSTMHPTLFGHILYLLPLRGPDGLAGGSKRHSYWGWSDPFESMWCCVGSALESHSKHGDTLYFTQAASPSSLLVALYDDSAATFPIPGSTTGAAVATVTQTLAWSTSALTVTVSVSVAAGAAGGEAFGVVLRIPAWAESPTAVLNGGGGGSIPATGAWFNVSRTWRPSGDVVVATFPFSVRLERLDDDRAEFADYFALVAGPYALGAITHLDNVIVGDNSSATPAWVRAVTADERSRSLSLVAVGAPQPVTYVRHDNLTSVWAAPLALPGGSTGGSGGGSPSYALQAPGFLAAGDDLYSATMTVAQAEALCTKNFSTCAGFTFQSADPNPSTPIDIYLKSAANFVAESGWTSYISSRVGTDMGGDEDGPDSTWVQDPPLAAGVANGVSLRSFNRPGEYISCPPSGGGGGGGGGQQCSIAHGTGASFQSSATFVRHSPGLTGGAGTVSFESAAAPGSYLSWYAGGGQAPANGTYPLVVLPNLPGNAAFANASTFDSSAGPNWQPPTLAYVATTGDGNVAGSRDLLLYPLADIVNEWYGLYLQVV